MKIMSILTTKDMTKSRLLMEIQGAKAKKMSKMLANQVSQEIAKRVRSEREQPRLLNKYSVINEE